MVHGKHFSGSRHAGLDLVRNQKDAEAVGQGAKSLEEGWRRRKKASLALNRFDD